MGTRARWPTQSSARMGGLVVERLSQIRGLAPSPTVADASGRSASIGHEPGGARRARESSLAGAGATAKTVVRGVCCEKGRVMCSLYDHTTVIPVACLFKSTGAMKS
jgi:hypothetical protein